MVERLHHHQFATLFPPRDYSIRDDPYPSTGYMSSIIQGVHFSRTGERKWQPKIFEDAKKDGGKKVDRQAELSDSAATYGPPPV